MKRLLISWRQLGISVEAVMIEDMNPILCNRLWEKLPMKGIQDHALISGEYLYGYIPMPELPSICHYNAKKKEPRDKQEVGRINLSTLQHFSIKYGSVNEYLEATPVAQIIESDIEKIKEVGRRTWESTFRNKQLIEFTISKLPEGKLIRNKKEHNKINNINARKLINEIDIECRRIWLKPPREIYYLFNGKSKCPTGSFGYYLNTIVFADGLMRSLGIMTFSDVLRMLDNKTLRCSYIKKIIQDSISNVVIDFLEYCGFKKLKKYYQKYCRIVPFIEDKSDLRAMILSMINYVNRLSGWILHYFPWALGEKMRRDL